MAHATEPIQCLTRPGCQSKLCKNAKATRQIVRGAHWGRRTIMPRRNQWSQTLQRQVLQQVIFFWFEKKYIYGSKFVFGVENTSPPCTRLQVELHVAFCIKCLICLFHITAIDVKCAAKESVLIEWKLVLVYFQEDTSFSDTSFQRMLIICSSSNMSKKKKPSDFYLPLPKGYSGH